ncbi:MAG: hypothetical protein AAF634_00610 [Bacteroidota bacterium]
MKTYRWLAGICLLLITGQVYAQSTFTGTFMTPDATMRLQFKPTNGEIHGLLVSTAGMYALKATTGSTTISGTVFTDAGNYAFSGQVMQGGLSIVSEGVSYSFYQTSTEHQLDGVDLSPYFEDTTAQKQAKTTPTTHTSNPNYSASEQEVFNYIAGGQLVYYQRTSYLNDSNASSLTYVNFCADGRFSLNWDGGFSVEGDYGGNAHGVTRGNTYGTWYLEDRQGTLMGILNFADGTQNAYAINQQYLAQGRWRIGNTQYAFVRNKAVCR